MKRVNLGEKRENVEVVKPRGETFYPTIYLCDKKLPIEKDKIGEILKAQVTLKYTGYSESKNEKGKESHSYNFDIHDIQFKE